MLQRYTRALCLLYSCPSIIASNFPQQTLISATFNVIRQPTERRVLPLRARWLSKGLTLAAAFVRHYLTRSSTRSAEGKGRSEHYYRILCSIEMLVHDVQIASANGCSDGAASFNHCCCIPSPASGYAPAASFVANASDDRESNFTEVRVANRTICTSVAGSQQSPLVHS